MRTRFLRLTLIAVTAAMLAAMLLSTLLIERLITREMRARLDAVLSVAAELAQNAPDAVAADPEGFADRLAADLSDIGQPIRITLIALDGTVLADSAASGPVHENHAGRTEVAQAIASGWGHDVRGSTVVDTRYVYAAMRSDPWILRAAMPMENVVRSRLAMAGAAGIGLLVGLAVAAAAIRTLSRRVARPIETMAAAARAFSNGDFSVRMDPAPDELGRLSESFNEMADRLGRSYAELEETNDKLAGMLQGMEDGILAVAPDGRFLLLTERLREMLGSPAGGPDGGNIRDGGPNYLLVRDILLKAAAARGPVREEIRVTRPEERLLTVFATPLHPERDEGALAVVADVTRLRKLEQIRSEFVANVTHELKTPLTSIRGYVELLKNGERDARTVAQFYEIIEIEAERLQSLIDDILQLSEIEGGRDEAPSLQPVPLAEVAAEIARRLEPVAEKAGVRILTDLDPALTLRAARLRIEQLFYNLVENAIKYNHPGGEVRISVRTERKFTVITVADTGIGIPPEHQERIFERFYRVDKSRSRQLGGTGLGLSIVKHIVTLYNGDISLVSHPGQGSLFIVRFP
ncbi:MAG: HAMP domain-containing protein [Clostridia bacterium]|nr:HAMP domain-containing protein [Clostridia bacterium]